MPQENQDELNDFGVPVGVELTFEQVRQMQRNLEARARAGEAGSGEEATATKLSVADLKAKLTELGVDIPDGAKKADLVALLDEALKPKE